MDAGLEHKQPDHQTYHHVGSYSHDAAAIQRDQHRHTDACAQQHHQGQLLGVEKSDDQNRTQVINDGHRSEKHLERCRNPAAQKNQHAKRKGNVGGCRNRPTAKAHRVSPIDCDVNQGRSRHPPHRGTSWERRLPDRGELPFHQLALDLQAYQEEENRHPQVVNPHHHGLGQHQQTAANADFARHPPCPPAAPRHQIRHL
jgi:hypothetical protein